MHISWLGQSALKLQTKHLDEDVVVLVDAYKPEKGEFPRALSADLALFSNSEKDAISLMHEPLVLATPGEVEAKQVMAVALPGNDSDLVFKILIEGLALVHLGHLTKKLTDEAVEKLGHVDILTIPAGSPDFSIEDAAALVTELEPRIVIPISHQCDSDPKAKPLSEFVKEVGLKPAATDKKFIFKKKDLPQEETLLYVLEKSI